MGGMTGVITANSTKQPHRPTADSGIQQLQHSHQQPDAFYASGALAVEVEEGMYPCESACVGVCAGEISVTDEGIPPHSTQVHFPPELKEGSQEVQQRNQQDAQIESLCENETSVDPL